MVGACLGFRPQSRVDQLRDVVPAGLTVLMAYWSAGAAAAGSTISVASSAAELARIVLWNVGDVLTVDSHVLAPKERGCPTALARTAYCPKFTVHDRRSPSCARRATSDHYG